jgi:hypothetical protein
VLGVDRAEGEGGRAHHMQPLQCPGDAHPGINGMTARRTRAGAVTATGALTRTAASRPMAYSVAGETAIPANAASNSAVRW